MKPSRYHVLRIFDWCEERYGRSKHNRGKVSVSYRKPDYVSEALDESAYYDADFNEMFISNRVHTTVSDLCSVIIEEYIHYTQSDREYQRLAKLHSYDTHPMEVEAKQISDRDCSLCEREVREKHSRFGGID